MLRVEVDRLLREALMSRPDAEGYWQRARMYGLSNTEIAELVIHLDYWSDRGMVRFSPCSYRMEAPHVMIADTNLPMDLCRVSRLSLFSAVERIRELMGVATGQLPLFVVGGVSG